ncbi:hypothetical protein K474DRAFT_1699892 [Panus rudis PR-1116 ss-1]|nr:hypothetical protein K474DRAFT_1699892 [Panus rudis PR-1116 ss-1]
MSHQPTSPRSTSSFDSFRGPPDERDHEQDEGENSLNGYDSSAALILVPEGQDEEGDPTVFDFTSDDEDAADEHFERLRSSSIPPLSSTAVFLYLLAPLLKFGAILTVDEGGKLPVSWAISAIIIFAVLCAFTRQIWYMLAKYVRRSDMEEILLEAFARGRGKERKRKFIRTLVRFSSGVFQLLLAVLYLRASVDVLVPLLPNNLIIPARYPITVLVALAIGPLCFARSIAATGVIYAMWTSIFTFTAWLACSAYAHATGILTVNPATESLGSLWQGISVIAFAFTTSFTLPLYAALRGTIQPGAGAPRPKRSQSFRLLTLLAVGIAATLILPLILLQTADAPLSAQTSTATTPFKALMAILNAITLALTVPIFIITSPTLPLPSVLRRATGSVPLSKVVLYAISVGLTLVPQNIAKLLSDITLVIAFVSTYFLPAFIHMTMHNFRRPLSIVIPPTPNPSTVFPPQASTSPTSALSTGSESREDELLQRKERLLQRRRLGRRIVWDIGVWTLLLPVGGGGLVWAVGRLAGRW